MIQTTANSKAQAGRENKMKKKIEDARQFVLAHIGTEATTGRVNNADTINDAANIFADDYSEYLEIWRALEDLK